MTSAAADARPFDVAIVGLGLVGAVLAGLLGQAGHRVWVGERMAGIHEIPRAIALDHEVMRVFQQLQVVDDVRPYTEPFTPSEWFGAQGQLIRRMTMVDPPYPQGYTPSLVFTQPPVERVLRERVARCPGVTLSLGTEVTSLRQDREGVELGLRDAQGRPVSVHARWVVGCDGGASTVRSLVGIGLDDLDFDEPWLVVDVHVTEQALARLPRTSVQYCEPERPCTMVIGPGRHRRWEISLRPGEDPAEAASPEGTWRLLSRWLTPDEGTLWRQSSYRFHALVAQRWREGRVFLAGDAAHMQPPFLGQGMCQGVRDAANLAWKLSAVLHGEVQGAAADRLLDTYGLEREAHVRELTSRLKHIGSIICERDPQRARARDERLLAECGGVVKDTPRQDVLPRLERGCLSRHDTTGRGTLFPQPRLAEGLLLDEAVGCGWRLVINEAEGTSLTDALPGAPGPEGLKVVVLSTSLPDAREGVVSPYPPKLGAALSSLGDKALSSTSSSGTSNTFPGPDGACLRHTRELDGVVSAWMQRHACRAALVRPDHYVFGTATSAAELQALLAECRAVLGA